MKEKNEVSEAKGIAQDAVGASLEVGTSMLLDNLPELGIAVADIVGNESIAMRRIISCQFNIDTACVDVEYEDGFVLSIYTPAVEDAVAHTMQQRSELDWLIYNDPLAYVGLVMSGKSEEYLKAVTR